MVFFLISINNWHYHGIITCLATDVALTTENWLGVSVDTYWCFFCVNVLIIRLTCVFKPVIDVRWDLWNLFECQNGTILEQILILLAKLGLLVVFWWVRESWWLCRILYSTWKYELVFVWETYYKIKLFCLTEHNFSLFLFLSK